MAISPTPIIRHAIWRGLPGGWRRRASWARKMRVSSAAKTVDDGAVTRSREALRELTSVAEKHGVGLMTENFLALMATRRMSLPSSSRWRGRSGCARTSAISRVRANMTAWRRLCPMPIPATPSAPSVRQWSRIWADFGRCLELARDAGYTGPYTLIYDGPNDDEWAGITLERDIVTPYLS